ncbi:MAG: hypothetical protein NTW30_04995, partial [Candidatus Aenigmarchaeota archaeon]|nr:hypothetical protein [Candidatus Aenigmarchaeota archaeon]
FSTFKKKPVFTLIFECGGRFLALGDSVLESIKKLKSTMGENSFLGFYTSAEHGFTKDMPPTVHSFSSVSFSISDELIAEK